MPVQFSHLESWHVRCQVVCHVVTRPPRLAGELSACRSTGAAAKPPAPCRASRRSRHGYGLVARRVKSAGLPASRGGGYG
eukprot:5487161-Prymnesium_polylepis.1